VVTLAGKFTGIEGGNRPTFISGGVQESRIQDIEGIFGGIYYSGTPTPESGAVERIEVFTSVGTGGSLIVGTVKDRFKASLVVKTGPDVAGTNVSTRLWRRTS
jgi:hypothetical protein